MDNDVSTTKIGEKDLSYIIGAGLTLVSLLFVGIKLYAYSDSISFSQYSAGVWMGVLVLSVAYFAANFCLVWAWKDIMRHLGVTLGSRLTIELYGISQLGKYIPGNIFHLVGRQALSMAAGLPGKPVLRSTAWELGIGAVAGAVFCPLALPILFPTLPFFSGCLLFGAGAGLCWYLLKHFGSKVLASAYLQRGAFLAITGILFVILYQCISPELQDIFQYVLLAIIYIVAWFIGFVTPGAPAGLGIREAVMLLLAGYRFSEADMLMTVLLCRVISTLGDIFFFAFAWVMKYLISKNEVMK